VVERLAHAAGLGEIHDKVIAGERLTREDGVRLFRSRELMAIGAMANEVRERLHGDDAFFVRNMHLNPTNVCTFRCPLCAYSCDPGDPRAYVMSREEIVARGRDAAQSGATELHVVGGVHPDKPLDWYLGILRDLHQQCPRLCLKAWTAVEIAWFAGLGGCSVRAVLERMIEAGLVSLPGGGAEIFAPAVRRRICPRKCDAEAWLTVMNVAHELGMHTSATMMFGHVETPEERVEHLRRVRELQDETAGFTAFIAWTFQHENTDLPEVPETYAHEYLKTLAVARLFLDNVRHLQSSWVTQGKKIGQVGLAFGADDMGSIMIEENVVSAAGTTHRMSQDEMEHLIRSAGFEPRQRTNLYERFVTKEETAPLARRYRGSLTAANRDLASPLPVIQ